MGLLVRPLGHLDIMSPPLILDPRECDLLVDTLGEAIDRGHAASSDRRDYLT